MIPTPTPPTDSLYKFMAISGIILMIVFGFLIFNPLHSDQERCIKYNEEVALLNIQRDILKEELEYSIRHDPQFDSTHLSKGEIKKYIIEYVYRNEAFKKKANEIKIKNAEMASKLATIEAYRKLRTEVELTYAFLLYSGEIISIIGFILWYTRAQKPIDVIEKQKLLKEELWKENCQSCFKTFFFPYERGNEEDGSISKLFCIDCYKSGKYTEPELIKKDAVERLRKKLSILKYGKIRRAIEVRRFKKNTLRWNRQEVW
ncbi:MAG TPA: zinc ribbon domain-containing protein [Bacteroidia bacterium]|nr:zinc ribbon domain-containing protein [Bacteroidia bacterium]